MSTDEIKRIKTELSKILDKTTEIHFVRARPVLSDPTRSVTTDTTFALRSPQKLVIDTTDNFFFFSSSFRRDDRISTTWIIISVDSYLDDFQEDIFICHSFSNKRRRIRM